MRMGVDPKRSVVNPYGESHDVKGLYVADASLFPVHSGKSWKLRCVAFPITFTDQILATFKA